MLNGEKFWIGNATLGDCLVWARNSAENGRIQAFYVDGKSKGYSASKIEGKYSLKSVQNASIKLENVFVPECNRLENCIDFTMSTADMLNQSRLYVAWIATGIAAGAYEAALKYTLKRQQFGKPIAQFQLVQERLSRMLALVECMISKVVLISLAEDLYGP